MSQFSYAAITRQDPNPFKRYLQNKRLRDAVGLLGRRRPETIVDYGAGDGELAYVIRRKLPDTRIVGFEPSLLLRAQAEAHIGAMPGVTLTDDAAQIADGSADAIFCLEVFEHLPPEETRTALAHMVRILKDDGVLIVGVPVEIGLAAWVKGRFRSLRRDDFDTDRNHIAQAVRRDIRFERFRVDFDTSGGYYPHHLGFDYRELLKALDGCFELEKRWSSPFLLMPTEWNSELNLLLTKRT
ncbi:class I SAM-dependent methyltransferase [Asticcacaulis sp. BYS171W]|uniref:Class I SAM-dependent methyltransferase n=1 Tax=Asticcacaulis aquaticus TaxID=2984212 RepID=A0ABT5HR64_9CAUL|nr:class I SAM-dependent methyltransferase [Asticcacaulis aquaticus]MDC7682555.1 class I SAM-dependent methyltransferase [Asticcacaulis aquaticus]